MCFHSYLYGDTLERPSRYLLVKSFPLNGVISQKAIVVVSQGGKNGDMSGAWRFSGNFYSGIILARYSPFFVYLYTYFVRSGVFNPLLWLCCSAWWVFFCIVMLLLLHCINYARKGSGLQFASSLRSCLELNGGLSTLVFCRLGRLEELSDHMPASELSWAWSAYYFENGKVRIAGVMV